MRQIDTTRWLVVPVAALFVSTVCFGDTKVEKVEYKGWKNNLRLSNGQVELIATLDVGPRIIRYGFVDGENVLKEYADQLGKSGEADWQIRGGHRLWHAPEAKPRTYFPDNDPVESKELASGAVRLTAPAEKPYGVQKEIDIKLDAAGAKVTLTHRIKNIGSWPVELAPWALTVMAPGGVEIIPLPKKIPHEESLLPNQAIILWSYTDLKDPRYSFGTKYITLRHDAKGKATKIGLWHSEGWVGYVRNGVLFVKRFGQKPGAHYPDNGCNFETFTNEDMLEVESLGPMTTVQPGAAVEHVEMWELHKNISAVSDEAAIDRAILPLVRGK
jgi:hypothetical protein